MKNKKGFTLIEILVVVVILAILTILVLPNLMDTFNESKKNSFTNEIRTLYTATESGWVKDFKENKGEIIYARTAEGECDKTLKINGRNNVHYYIKVDKKGLIVEYYVEDGTYQYTYFGEGLKKEQIQNALEVTKITNNQRVTITCDGVTLPEAGSSKLTIKPGSGEWNGSTEDKTFTQLPGTTKIINNPVSPINFTITYNDNGQGATFTPFSATTIGTFTGWTVEGGMFDSNSKKYTFTTTDGTLSANYNIESINLPAITKTEHVCKWAEGSTTGTEYAGGTSRPVTKDISYYAKCVINKYTLTVNPNGGTWNGSSNTQTFTQDYGSIKTITAPTVGPTYTITYNMNGTGITTPTSPTSAVAPFNEWVHSGNGSFSGTTYTYGSGNGTLLATYEEAPFILPNITKAGSTCKWAEGSASGLQYTGGTGRTTDNNITYYAMCTLNSYTLTVNPNGGVWNGSSSTQTFTQNYGTTKTIAAPASTPTYTITYNMNGTGITAPTSPTSVNRSFTNWTLSGGGTFSGTTYTYGTLNGTLTANYNTTSNAFILPTISKTGYTCKWAEGSTSGTQYNGGTSRTITSNKTYYAICNANSYKLTVNPNGGVWNGSSNSQEFTQDYGTTKVIANPSSGPTYTITYNANSQGATYTGSPTSVQRPFTSWTKSGTGSLSGTTYTYGAGAGTLTANYNGTSNSFTLPTITKTGYTCKWAQGSASGTQYAGGTSRTITSNTTFYAVCTINSYTLTINPNGGTWSGSTSNQTFTQNYNTTKTIANPTAGPTYTISYNANSQGASYTSSPTSVQRPFTSWSKSGSGSISGTTYTFGPGNGTLTATYNSTSNSFTLPSISKTGYTCQWAEGSTSGSRFNGGTTRTITANTTYYAVCMVESYSLVVNPNGGTWNSSTSSQTFTQNYNTTKTIADPSVLPTYTISYNANSQGASYTASPTSITRAFTGWTHSGSGTWTASSKTFTFGNGTGTLTAGYNGTSASFTLPTISKTGYTCKWAQGSASGTQYAGGTTRTITANTTFYAVCTVNQYTLTINPNGGTWGGKTTNSTVTQNYNTTYTVANPTAGPTYTIAYNMNSTGVTAPTSPTSVQRPFTSWTKSGTGSLSGTTFTFGAGAGTLTANYNATSASFTLPALSKTGYTCKWAEGSTTGTQYTGGTARTITANTTYYAVCTINQYTLTVNSNGGTWSGSTSNQTFNQNYNTTKTIANPTATPTYTITYNANSQGATYTASPTSVARAFTSWTKSGSGSISGTTYTFGAGNGTLTAAYNSTSNSFTLPAITKTGYTCKWAQGSASGTQYAGSTSRTITANTTFYAVCTINQYTLTVNPNGGTWSGSTSNQTFNQNYNTTKTIANPTATPSYTISYNMNGTGITAPTSPTSVARAFTSWTKSGTGTISGTTFTFGAGNGTLTAAYNSTSNSFTLPALSKTGYTCKWAEGSTSGTQYAGGTARTITANKTYYAVCTINQYTLTVAPNGGTWGGKTTNSTVSQNYNTTYTVANPTAGPTYTIGYNMNSTGVTAPTSPTSVQRAFTSWTKSGTGTLSGTTFTFGAGNGTLTAAYNSTSNSFTLPACAKTGYTCKWAAGSASGTQSNCGSSKTITANTTFYLVCTINQYTLTVNPNGGTWSGSTSNQTFNQNYNTTKTIANPTATPTYTISYNANGQGATYTASPTSVSRPFTSWTKSGTGTISGTTFTFGAGNGTLTAAYNSTSSSFTLPAISKTGYTCKWAKGSASGTQIAGSTSTTVTANTTFYAVCTINQYTLTVNPNGGTWNGGTGNQTFTQNYNTTKTIANPTAGAKYTISYNMNGTGITAPTSPTSANRAFTSWTKSGTGTLSGTTFTFGAGNGTLTAAYNSTSASFTLPALSKTGYTCKWAQGSASGTQYAPGASRTITANTTFYAVCTGVIHVATDGTIGNAAMNSGGYKAVLEIKQNVAGTGGYAALKIPGTFKTNDIVEVTAWQTRSSNSYWLPFWISNSYAYAISGYEGRQPDMEPSEGWYALKSSLNGTTKTFKWKLNSDRSWVDIRLKRDSEYNYYYGTIKISSVKINGTEVSW